MSRPHIAVATFIYHQNAEGAHGSLRPFVVAACDRPGQVERVDLATAPLVRALPDGRLVDVRTDEPVDAGDVCRNCLKAEGAL